MNKPEDFNIRDFMEKYSLIYDRLYKWDEAIDKFRESDHPDWLLAAFALHRGDWLTSDREIVAFMLAAEEMGYLG